jgi:hypothetical protein
LLQFHVSNPLQVWHCVHALKLLRKLDETETMKILRIDNERRRQLGFQLNTYGVDLSGYEFEAEI